MINKSQYHKINTSNLGQNEADRKWRLFEEEQAVFNMQASPFSSMAGRVKTVAPPAPELTVSIPVANWTANFDNVSLNNGGNLIIIPDGGEVSFYADYSLDYVFDAANCPSCIVQFYAGLVTDGITQTNPLWCISVGAGDQPNVSGSIFVPVTIPNVPGIYYISSTFGLNFSCDPTAVFTQNSVLGIVVVP
jgi:hypothetical protein